MTTRFLSTSLLRAAATRSSSPSPRLMQQQARRLLLSTTAASASSNNSSSPPFDKILIANRGEIASRIMRTCHALGIETVAIYTTQDAKAPFVQEATQSVCVGAAPTSYLDTDRVFEAIQLTGAQAVHPGYGFLSENASFARATAESGATWLGPTADAIHAMGDKLESKELAKKAGVNVIPGVEGELESLEHALEIARSNTVPYPILLKAAAGGGGKGMRICHNDDDVKDTFALAKAEALKFFADDRLLMEKYVENPHHVEFQLIASPEDVCVFVERECSIQRRHQKLIEESPSPMLQESTRQAMVQQVKQLVKEVGYTSAGTMEFLVDEQQNFYFLEMNTRLQVEHPVTEMVTGQDVDLVKAMLWVGAGWGIPPEILDRQRADVPYIPWSGHAIEARVYAEDPTRNFLPSTGPLLPYREPSQSETVRVDSGVTEGHVVTPHYDPMLSKVIAHGETRQEAIATMANAMDQYVIGKGSKQSIQHSTRLVRDIMRQDAFQQGNTPTSFLETNYPDGGFRGVSLTTKESMELAACMVLVEKQRNCELKSSEDTAGTTVDEDKDGDVRVCLLGGMFGDAYEVRLVSDADPTLPIEMQVTKKSRHGEDGEDATTSTFHIRSDDTRHNDRLISNISVDNVSRPIQVLSEAVTGDYHVQMHGANMNVMLQSPREYELSVHMRPPASDSALGNNNLVLSPMPGTLVSYAVSPEERVVEGQELCVVEAMKMQNIIRSPRKGAIKSLAVDVGSSLMSDQVLLEFEDESSSSSSEDEAA